MLINEKTDKVLLCRYQVAQLIFILEDKKIKMNPSNIISIEKVDDFEFNIRSIIKVSLRLDIRKKKWILNNKRKIRCKFELDKVGYDSDGDEVISGPESVWNMEFAVYFNDDDEAVDTATMEQSLEGSNDDSFAASTIDETDEDYFESQNVFDIYLFHEKTMNASEKTINRVYTSGICQQFIAEVLTKSGHKKVLMSPIQNNKHYNEVLIPAFPAYKALSYLDQNYGLYKYGSIIFYDLDILYIINPNGKVTAKRKDEWTETTFLITNKEKSLPGNGMVRKPDENVFYINITEENVSPQKSSEGKNDKLGSAAKVVITDDITIDYEEADQSYMSQRNEYIRYIKKDDNRYTPTMIKARMEENEAILYINGDNFDINAFTPNKEYKIVFQEASKQKKYGKFRYRISYAYHFIKAETEGYMISSHRIVLKKCSTA